MSFCADPPAPDCDEHSATAAVESRRKFKDDYEKALKKLYPSQGQRQGD